MTMDVGDRLEVRSKTTISESDMGDAEWVIESGVGINGDGVPFIVQFPCSGTIQIYDILNMTLLQNFQ